MYNVDKHGNPIDVGGVVDTVFCYQRHEYLEHHQEGTVLRVESLHAVDHPTAVTVVAGGYRFAPNGLERVEK